MFTNVDAEDQHPPVTHSPHSPHSQSDGLDERELPCAFPRPLRRASTPHPCFAQSPPVGLTTVRHLSVSVQRANCLGL